MAEILSMRRKAQTINQHSISLNTSEIFFFIFFGKTCSQFCFCGILICGYINDIFSKNAFDVDLILSWFVTKFVLLFSSFSDVQTTNGILGADISNLVSSTEYNVIRLAFALTVPGMFVLCLGVNFLCYKMYVLANRFCKL